MRRFALSIALSVAACGPLAVPDDSESDADASMSRDVLVDGAIAEAADGTADRADATEATDASTYEREYLFSMAAQAFPDSGHPGVLVHIPPTFDAASRFGVVFYVHGFKNCIVNCVEDVGASCTPGAAPRAAYNLIAQFDAQHVQALLVLPELEFDQSTGAPGRLGVMGGLYAFLDELFTTHLAPIIGLHRIEDLGRIAIISHSGGYEVAAIAATMGGVTQVREIDLLDSLYGETALFDGFVMDHVARGSNTGDPLGVWRFASVYTDSGGTAANNTAMAMRAMGWVALPGTLLWDDTYATLMSADYQHPLIFKRSELAHDSVPRYYFGEFVAASGF